MNIRHDLEKNDVNSNIRKKINDHLACMRKSINNEINSHEEFLKANLETQKRWIRPRTNPVEKDLVPIYEMYMNWIDEELNHYSKVRVIELPVSGDRFILVYGDTDDSTVETGTGPFSSYEDAEKWFLNNGR